MQSLNQGQGKPLQEPTGPVLLVVRKLRQLGVSQ